MHGSMYTTVNPRTRLERKISKSDCTATTLPKLRPSPLYYVQKGWPPCAVFNQVHLHPLQTSRSRFRRPPLEFKGVMRGQVASPDPGSEHNPSSPYEKLWSWNRTSNTTRTKRALRTHCSASKDRSHAVLREQGTDILKIYIVYISF